MKTNLEGYKRAGYRQAVHDQHGMANLTEEEYESLPKDGSPMPKRATHAEYFTTDGKVTRVAPKNGESFTLEELQKLVGGRIEIVSFPGGRECIVVNEEGLLHNLPYNELASAQWRIEFPRDKYPHNNSGVIVGDALIAPRELVS